MSHYIMYVGALPYVNQVLVGTVAMAGLTLGGVAVLFSRGGKPEVCDICGGQGMWKCVICDGRGSIGKTNSRLTPKCPACVGRGKRLCKPCNASGWKRRSMFLG